MASIGGGSKMPGSGGGGGSSVPKTVALTAAKPVTRIGVLTYYREQNIDILTEIRGFLPQDAKESAARRHSPELVALTRAVGRQLYEQQKTEVAILNDPERCETWQGLETLMRDVRADVREIKERQQQQQRGKTVATSTSSSSSPSASIKIEEITDENEKKATVDGGDGDDVEDAGWERLTIRERLQPLTCLVAAAGELEQRVAERVPPRPITERDTVELVRLADACCRTLRHARLLRFGDVMRLAAPAQRERLVDSMAMFYKFARVVALTPPLYEKCCAALGALDRLLQTAHTSVKQLTRNVFALMPILIGRFTTDPHWQAVVYEHVSSLGTGILTSIVDVFGVELGNRQLEAVFDRARDPRTGSISVERLMATGQTLYRLEGGDDDDDGDDQEAEGDEYEGDFEGDFEGDYDDDEVYGAKDVDRSQGGGGGAQKIPEVARARGGDATPTTSSSPAPMLSRAPTASGARSGGSGGSDAKGDNDGGVRLVPLVSAPLPPPAPSSRPPPPPSSSASRVPPTGSRAPSKATAPPALSSTPAGGASRPPSSAPSLVKVAAKKPATPVAVVPAAAAAAKIAAAAPQAVQRYGGRASPPTATTTTPTATKTAAHASQTLAPSTAAVAPPKPQPGSGSHSGGRGGGGGDGSARSVSVATARPAPKTSTAPSEKPQLRMSSQSAPRAPPAASAARTSRSVVKAGAAVATIAAETAPDLSSSSSSSSSSASPALAPASEPPPTPRIPNATSELPEDMRSSDVGSAPSATATLQSTAPETVSRRAEQSSAAAAAVAVAAVTAMTATESEMLRQMRSMSPQRLAALFRQTEAATRTSLPQTRRRTEETESPRDVPDGQPNRSENPTEDAAVAATATATATAN